MKMAAKHCVLAVVITLFMTFSSVDNLPQYLRRTKRTILQMCELIQHHTNRGCLAYNDYGCFCGWGNAGSGRKHIDDVDSCCRLHDDCYGDVSCMWFYPQIVGYSFQCHNNGTCTCLDSRFFSPCARSVCDCDLRFAECLGRAQYNDHHRDYDWQMCNRS